MQGRFEPRGGGWWLAATGWLVGTACHLQLTALWPWPAYAALTAVCGALGLALAWASPGRARLAGLSALVAAGLALASAGWRAADRLADALLRSLEGQDVVVTGVVAQMPRSGPSGLRFVFEVEGATRAGQAVKVPALISLGWYRGFDLDAWLAGPAHELRAGQRWR